MKEQKKNYSLNESAWPSMSKWAFTLMFIKSLLRAKHRGDPAVMNYVQGGEGSTAGVTWPDFKDRKSPWDSMEAGEGEVASKVKGAGQARA